MTVSVAPSGSFIWIVTGNIIQQNDSTYLILIKSIVMITILLFTILFMIGFQQPEQIKRNALVYHKFALHSINWSKYLALTCILHNSIGLYFICLNDQYQSLTEKNKKLLELHDFIDRLCCSMLTIILINQVFEMITIVEILNRRK